VKSPPIVIEVDTPSPVQSKTTKASSTSTASKTPSMASKSTAFAVGRKGSDSSHTAATTRTERASGSSGFKSAVQSPATSDKHLDDTEVGRLKDWTLMHQ